MDGQVETPAGVADVTFIDPTKPIKVVPVLRAGLVLLESTATLLPATETYHVGYSRDETTLESTCYLNKLPQLLSADDLVLVSDCMLATGRFFFFNFFFNFFFLPHSHNLSLFVSYIQVAPWFKC